jgi:eukaryotic-like serine/threonine-protein kinase
MRQIGRYRLDAVQGVGAFATVWRGWDEELHAEVAVKILADNWIHNRDVRERFLDEARILRRIVDGRVVRVHDVGIVDERPYFVMDFIGGGTADDLIGTLDLQAAVDIAEQAARAVQVLHDNDVLHRDIKPSNFLLDSSRVLVSDLGSAKRLAEASRITVTTGTPAYMAPEQVMGDPLDARADVYALGVMAYELITGKPPALGRRSLTTGTSPTVDKAIGWATKPKPEDRPDTAAEFADALSRALRPKIAATASRAWVAAIAVAGFATAFASVWAYRA